MRELAKKPGQINELETEITKEKKEILQRRNVLLTLDNLHHLVGA